MRICLRSEVPRVPGVRRPDVGGPRWLSRFVDECSDVSLEETQLVGAALAALPTAPYLARPVLRELVQARKLVTVTSVFEDAVSF
jgi:hypothetical protein